jgi:hypothetical protein
MMTRAEIETTIEPIIEKCRLRFAPGSSDANDSPPTEETLRPEIRRVSLIVSLAQTALGSDATGEGLEVGSGYGYLILPMTVFFPTSGGPLWTIRDNLSRLGLPIDPHC